MRHPQPRVLLIHGMARTAASMLPAARALRRAQFSPHLFHYRSMRWSIGQAGDRLASKIDALIKEGPPVHLVGHSLGNILIRWAIQNGAPHGLGRIVMLAPPNQGSAVATRHARLLGPFLKPLTGLTDKGDSLARTLLLPEGVDIGIIAGHRDGKVSVDETRLAGAKVHRVVQSGHTFIMARPFVHRMIIHFLNTGAFEDGSP